MRAHLLLGLLLTSLAFAEERDYTSTFYHKYNIPPNASAVLIFGQASHLDWDWLNWFPTNVNNNPPSVIPYFGGSTQPTDTIFAQATQQLADSNYGYSVCEMGFLRRYAIDNPSGWAAMKSSPGKLHIVGGGITSPDNLLPHGEAFIRDYLVGISWLKTENVPWSGAVWLPDDFGHDSQLPVMLQAIGVKAASFSRVPGGCQQGLDSVQKGFVSAHKVLLDEKSGGLDFWWQANDGSTSYCYYQPNSYCAGDGILSSTGEPNSPSSQASCSTVPVHNVTDRIEAYIGVRNPLRKTPYMYVATGCDFTVPVPNLVSVLNVWNSMKFPTTGIYAVAASFDDYAELVLEYITKNGVTLPRRNFHGTTPTTTFRPTPYWMGFYTSRVANKQLHYDTVKALVGAEIFLSIASKTGVPTSLKKEQLESTWNLTAPSTHHDYVTGTATDYVVLGEQQPLLKTVFNESTKSRDTILGDIVSALNGSTTQNPVFAVFNQLGIARSGYAAISPNGLSEDQLRQLPNVQKTASGEYISIFSAPSLGYSTTKALEPRSLGLLRVSSSDDSFVLENLYLKATVNLTANWAVTSLIDKAIGSNIIQSANILQFRYDNGDIYRFGYEEGCGFGNYNPQITALNGSIIENGPVRVTVKTAIKVTTAHWERTYDVLYSLVVTEPFLRISVNGSAAPLSTVITEIKFNEMIETYEHGTPYHWDYKEPFPYGLQSDFRVTMEATHDFIVPRSASGSILGAVYQNNTPAWGVSEDKFSLFGVLLRNGDSNCAGKGASGTDSDPHFVSYALRISSRLSGAVTGQPLREARGFHTALVAYYVPNISDKILPSTFSLASLIAPSSGLITVAKPGEYDGNSIFFRVYYPDNTPLQVVITLSSVFSSSTYDALITTALEEPLDNEIVTWGSGNSISFKASGALSTVQLKPKSK